MKSRMRKALLAGVVGLSMSAAEAAYIVDTGPGNSFSALSLTASQQFGATFKVAQASQITSVEGWISQGTARKTMARKMRRPRRRVIALNPRACPSGHWA